MESPDNIESELQLRKPRKIKNRGGFWGAVKPFWVILLPHTWIAIAAPVFVCLLLARLVAAEPFPGQITQLHTSWAKKGGTHYHANFDFEVANKAYRGEDTLSQGEYEELRSGENSRVYALPLLPEFMPHLRPTLPADWFLLVFAIIWSVIWCGVTFSIVWFSIERSLRSRYLVANGIPIRGLVGEVKTTGFGRRTQHTLPYSYEANAVDPRTGKTSRKTFEGKIGLNTREIAEANTLNGKEQTILIDDEHPERSIIYRFADYVAVR